MLIDKIWERIKQCEGDTFKQIRGKEFTYSVEGNYVYLNTTERSISKNEFAKALKLVPLENTVQLQKFQAPSYLFAILMDKHIRKTDW
ncbi:hypothetical protein ABE29_20370 [Cytobacillus firmus]|uniref:hypothetical protein n=1 Tax=Cytobacillus firmus TaxID=1399 RepID=UPI00077C6BE1|nr:hypothetical protein [Cytobacillus firmus]MBG9545031.1 hypothetical protein [Cytobacillus firmus]MBG9552269.1 hypothetical protein [Cytobacillus firmus]MBG9555667.1 hypothetical protein [Cytobacillus firmus]MBG9576754.1 hypothetical protein [Cytobacillus firmus]MEC1895501.1 hypothetical protein [Cytobacillus firmus]